MSKTKTKIETETETTTTNKYKCKDCGEIFEPLQFEEGWAFHNVNYENYNIENDMDYAAICCQCEEKRIAKGFKELEDNLEEWKLSTSKLTNIKQKEKNKEDDK